MVLLDCLIGVIILWEIAAVVLEWSKTFNKGG